MISVIITSYNRPDQLLKAIESVKKQTFKDYEIIVVDDCSKEEIKVPEGVIFKKLDKNSGGPANPRNEGVKLAKGEYICFLDEDNEYREDHLMLLHQAIEGVDVAYGDRMVIEDGQYKGLGIAEDFSPQSIMDHNFIDTSDFIIRKELLVKVGGWDEQSIRMLDWNLMVRLYKYGCTFKRIPIIITDYHIHNNQLSGRPERVAWNPVDVEIELPYLSEVTKPKVAAIVLTYDRLEYTMGSLESLDRTAGQSIDVYIVDNGSTDGTTKWLKTFKDSVEQREKAYERTSGETKKGLELRKTHNRQDEKKVKHSQHGEGFVGGNETKDSVGEYRQEGILGVEIENEYVPKNESSHSSEEGENGEGNKGQDKQNKEKKLSNTENGESPQMERGNKQGFGGIYIRESSEPSDGGEAWICPSTQIDNGETYWEVFGKTRGSSSYKQKSKRQSDREFDFVRKPGGTYSTSSFKPSIRKVHIIFNKKNKGISIATNQALDAMNDEYDIVMKSDNDAYYKTEGWLAKMVDIWQSNRLIALSCFIEGLRENPGGAERLAYGVIRDELIGVTRHLGGICHFVDAKVYKTFRWNEDSTLHGIQDLELSRYLVSMGYGMGYLENYFCEHKDGTGGQEIKYKEYFERRKIEKTTKYDRNYEEIQEGESAFSTGTMWGDRVGETIQRYKAFFKGKVLDIGCNDGYGMEKIKELGCEVWGVDIAKNKVERAIKKGLNVKRGYMENLPYKDKEFDIIFCSHTLEHSSNVEKAVKEMKRVAKRVIIVVPIENGTKNPAHISFFGSKEDLKKHFTDWETLKEEELNRFESEFVLIADENSI